MATKSRRKTLRHRFQFTAEGVNQKEAFSAFAVVRQPTRAVTLVVTEQDVLESIKKNGVGNTQTCTMALCCQRLAKQFPHKVDTLIDWQYRTCYVVSKRSKKTGLPSECYRYVHNNKIAHLNDTPGGQKTLLKMIRDAGGSIEIIIRPRSRKDITKKGGTGKGKDGSRSTSTALGNGAKRRFAIAHLGLVA